MSKYTYLIDPGHGGVDPSTGKYVTPGKRSPKFDDGSVLYEGVENRKKAAVLAKKMTAAGLDNQILVNTWKDVELSRRVTVANEFARQKKCVFISLHSDAAGDGSAWHLASGISVYTSKGQTRSDVLAELMVNELQRVFTATVKWRLDTSDGDKDKEEDFYVLRKTSMPAVLLELGFHTNKDEALRMQTDEWRSQVADAIVSACLEFEKL